MSRGGEKLAAALDRFDIDVTGATALDVGASTGGFTDCLLQRGASVVVALDVGHGQLDEGLRRDRRVRVVERTNIRHLTPDELARRTGGVGGPFDLVTADLSFISLIPVVPILTGSLARPGSDLVLLVKPQFEAGRAEASRGKGVIRDPQVWQEVLERVGHRVEQSGAAIMGVMCSPLAGAAGNLEFLLHARVGPPPGTPEDVAGSIAGAVAEAAGRHDGGGN